MKYLTLGKNLRISNLCFGTMYFGTKTSKTDSFRLLDAFIHGGGNFIDTSNNYAFWMENGFGNESEEMIGQWLKARGGRNNLMLATKVGARPRRPGDGPENLEGLSFDTIIEAVEGSLKRLQTDYIDLYYAHVDFLEYPLEERLEAFDRLFKEGKIREVGVSNLHPWRLEQSLQLSREHQWLESCCIQLKHSFLRPSYNADFWVQKQIDRSWLEFVSHHKGQQLIAYSPLLSGAYAGREWPEGYATRDNELRMQELTNVADELDITPNQLVLAWMLYSSPVIIPLISASSREQLEENMMASSVVLSDEIITTLNQAGE